MFIQKQRVYVDTDDHTREVRVVKVYEDDDGVTYVQYAKLWGDCSWNTLSKDNFEVLYQPQQKGQDNDVSTDELRRMERSEVIGSESTEAPAS